MAKGSGGSKGSGGKGGKGFGGGGAKGGGRNPNYPSTNPGKPSGVGRGNTPKSK